MEFPMTRERLQCVKVEIDESQVKEFIHNIVEYIKLGILSNAYNGSKSLRLNLPLHPRFNAISYEQQTLINLSRQTWKKEYLPEIISRLQTLFPDVSFQVDPLKTYLLVDWS